MQVIAISVASSNSNESKTNDCQTMHVTQVEIITNCRAIVLKFEGELEFGVSIEGWLLHSIHI